MDYKELAADILKQVGGADNVNQVVHCATRLRFTLKDDTAANTDALKKTKGILSVVNAGGQYQIVIGPEVPRVYQEVMSLGNFENKKNSETNETQDNRSRFSRLLEGIASIFQPIIPAITGAGLLKAFMALFVAVGVLTPGTQTYIILNAMADAAFYFMPILLAASCARKFKCNQGTAMALAGILVYPALIALLTGEEAVRFLGILPVTKANYPSSVIPIILGIWFMAMVEHLIDRISPRAIKFFSVPLLSLVIGGTVTLLILGPAGVWVSNLINVFFTGLNRLAPWIVPTVVGIFTPFLVMTGTHYGLIPIGTNNLATVKWDTVVGPGMLCSNVAQGAAGLAVGLRSRDPEVRQQASSAGLTGVLGITEPVLYGINLRYTFPLYAAMIGGGIGGLFMGITRTARFAGGSPGLLVLPAYIPTADVTPLGYTMNNFTCAVIGVLIAMAAAFAASWILYGVWEKKGKGVLYAPVSGECIPLSQVEDEVFASGALGPGVAFLPSEGEIHAPCDGEISTFFPTGHAIGITASDGSEWLIHVGMNTVELDGEGFTPLAEQGEKVRKGQLLLRFQMDFIQAKGYSLVTPMVLTNEEETDKITPTVFGLVTAGDEILEYEKSVLRQ